MIAVFASLAASRSINFNELNHNKVFNNTNGLPILIEIWSPWCPHCQEFEESWRNITNSEKWHDRVVFADINCDENKAYCKRFPGDGTPRLIWYTADGSESKQYFGRFLIDPVEDFIEKQLRPAIQDLEDNEPMKEPAFLFKVSRDDIASITVMEKASSLKQNLYVYFYLTLDDEQHPPSLQWFSRERRGVEFTGEWTVEEITKFIDVHMLPSLMRYTNIVSYILESTKQPYFAFILDDANGTAAQKAKQCAPEIDHLAPVIMTDCTTNKYICRYVSRKPNSKGNLVYMTYNGSQFWRFDQELEPATVKKWAEEVISGTVVGSGPGDGVFLTTFYRMRAMGGFRYYILYVPILIAIVVIGMMCALCCMPAPKSTSKPKSD